MFHLHNLEAISADLGHTDGDAAAVEMAHQLVACFRDSDIVSRLAPDLFCVLLAGTDLDGVENARYRLDEQISRRNRDSSYPYELLLHAHAVAFKKGRHADAVALLQDAESRINEAREREQDELSAEAG